MNRTGMYEVKVKAWKPARLVTIAKFGSYELASDCFQGLLALGFTPLIEHPVVQHRSNS